MPIDLNDNSVWRYDDKYWDIVHWMRQFYDDRWYVTVMGSPAYEKLIANGYSTKITTYQSNDVPSRTIVFLVKTPKGD